MQSNFDKEVLEKLTKINIYLSNNDDFLSKNYIKTINNVENITTIYKIYDLFHPRKQVIILNLDIEKWKLAKNKVIIVTHSDSVLNFLSRKIRIGELESNDVKIFIFEETEIIQSYIDQEGALLNWPVGWFYPYDVFNEF